MWLFSKAKPKVNQAALRLYNIAKSRGDAINALAVAEHYGIKLSEGDYQNLYNAVAVLNDRNAAGARQMLALLPGWAEARGEPHGDERVLDILVCDPALVGEVAMAGGIRPELRCKLLRQMLDEKTCMPVNLYDSLKQIPPDMQGTLREEVAEYALGKGHYKCAYHTIGLGYYTRPVSPTLREQIAAGLIALQGTREERAIYMDMAATIV